MDIATILEEYLADVASLPGDLAFILDEIKLKDQKLLDAQRRIQQRDGPIQKFVKTNGASQEFAKEQTFYPRIRSDYQECILLQQEKTRLATMGLFLMSRQVGSLDKQVAQLEAEGTLPPVVPVAEESFHVPSLSPEPAPKPRKATSDRRMSRPDPRKERDMHKSHSASPSHSRHSTPATPTPGSGTASARTNTQSSTTSAPGAANGTPSHKHETRRTSTYAQEQDLVKTSLKRAHPQSQSPRQRHPVEESGESFCYCKKGSVGNMIACDSDDCAIEWFHWECVGLSSDPTGSWYCPDCRVKIKKIR